MGITFLFWKKYFKRGNARVITKLSPTFVQYFFHDVFSSRGHQPSKYALLPWLNHTCVAEVFLYDILQKVVYAESGNDFVDVLLSFLTLPLGTIARLVAEESNIEAVEFGSLSKLYQSVSDLDEKYLWNQTCKQMLLKPRNPMEAYCKKMKLNIDQSELNGSLFLTSHNI
ncbi:hypothetical protein KIW84_034373 [Lathyrus oleraceus]|uniref:Uncharacterized protein n=1 Tax=Pisum sativum TaxID=3888 RepID=A0A9D5AZA7_PEA|nr:hypothetical protein KIW84_034373 [Pisum sativum]